MKTAIYRYIWLIVALHCGLPCAFGQTTKAPTGNLYTENKYDVDVSGFKILSKLVNGTDIGHTATSKDLTNIPWNGTSGFWWTADRNGSLELTVDCGSDSHDPYYIFGIGEVGTPTERPTGIIIEQRKQEGDEWKLLLNRELSRSETTKYDYMEEVRLSSPITDRYFRVTFKTNETEHLAFNYFKIYTMPYIRHKHAKWYELRAGVDESARRLDTFNETDMMVTPADNPFIWAYDDPIQAAHTYIDTIYMHRGTSVDLVLPDYRSGDGDNAIRTYQRWYSFRRDKTFETNHSDGVYDLLTPTPGAPTPVRFGNGYVGNPVVKASTGNNYFDKSASATRMTFYMPESDEFARWFPDAADFDDRWFVVACDVSGYNDYTETYDEGKSPNSVFFDGKNMACWEPTLTHRVLFYIAAVDDRGVEKNDSNWVKGHGRLVFPEYQGGGNTASDKYLEEYTIIRPFYRLNDKQEDEKNPNSFYDVVSLSKNASSYVIPDMAASDKDQLDVKFVDNTAQVVQITTGLSGTSRNIRFGYPTPSSYGGYEVNGDSVTILVTKTINKKTYNIARYRLVFDKRVTLLPQSVIKGLDGDSTINAKWGKYIAQCSDYKTRTPSYMMNNYQLVTSLTWDYDTNIPEVQSYMKGYYNYPMNWNYCSYGFYDGSGPENYKGAGYNDGRTVLYPEWGHYGITTEYAEKVWGRYPGTIDEPEGGSYHMYIDASERPGTIASLPFRESLCAGAELFVSAWVKEAGWDDESPGSGMLFTIMGVTETGAHVPLCRYGTGQFRRSTFLSSNIPGCGSGNNEWMHVYFSFINQSEVEYDSYLLQIDNNSVSSDGADMYLDAVRIFVAQPSAVVKQKTATCGSSETLMNIELDWDRLMSRTGRSTVAGSDSIGAVDFCFVDRIKYEAELSRLTALKDTDAVKKALELSVVETGRGANKRQFSQLHYYIYHEKNKVYGKDGTLAADNIKELNGEERGFFYGQTEDGVKSLSVDFYSTLSANHPYWILLRLTNTSGKRPTVDDFASEFVSPCAIRTEFYIEATNQIAVEGEIVDPTLNEYCEGQLLNFRPSMRYATGETDDDGSLVYEYITGETYYDWFLASEDVFTRVVDADGFSINEALKCFRAACPIAEELPERYADIAGSDAMKAGFTEAMYDTLRHYADADVLLLCRHSLDIRLESPGLMLVIVPVEAMVEVDDNTVCCWEYTPLALRITDGAPTLKAGFSGISYPTVDGEDYAPNMRIGLAQIRKAVNAENALFCNLCSPTLVTSASTHVGRVTGHESDNKIYLVETDDPNMAKWLTPEEGVSLQFACPVGWVNYLRAYRPGEYVEPNQATFYFDLDGKIESKVRPGFKFEPREGYRYKFAVYFEEKRMGSDGKTESAGNSCIGILHVTMYVVPEYLIWNGTPLDNWNNDDNWQRVNSAGRINKKKGTYDVYTENAFVPMPFSKVIIPRDKKVELYVAGYNQSSGSGWSWNSDGRPGYIGEPTPNIQYDMMVIDNPATAATNAGRLTTAMYRVYWIDKIHFEPGAQMRGAEYLIYNGAEVDYELTPGEWHPLTSPLQGTVAGDFYTDAGTAVEQGEYFQPITFDASANSRLAPYVFQRDWDAEAAELMKVGDGSDTSNVAIAGNWSGVYNDVDEWETYQPGCGFSLKVTQMPKTAGGTALFRLPKADTEYTYFDTSGSATGIVKGVSEHRTDYHGNLITDSLFHRVAYDVTSSDGTPIKIDLPKAADGTFYMIGNPFMTYLDVSEFFETNEKVLEPKYWMGSGNGAAAGTDDSGWVATTDESPNIPPLKAFFVQKREDAADSTEITLDACMQAVFPEAEAASAGMSARRAATRSGGTAAGGSVLRIKAMAADGGVSTAAVRFSDRASAGYLDREDVMLLVEPDIARLPLVYTVGGDRALTINASPAGCRIPLGVCNLSDGDVTLCFTGAATCGDVQLYDALSGSYTPLTEGYTLSVTSGDEGRYYITGGDDGGISLRDEDAAGGISVYSVRRGEITVVSSTSEIASVQVCGAGGARVATASGGGRSVRIAVPSGAVYIVKAADADGFCRTVKVAVR